MNSTLKSETARENGAKSNGPVTAEGKAVSAMNSLKHGLCSKQIVMPGEDPKRFERVWRDFSRRFNPQGRAEKEMVKIIAATSWRLKRVIQIESALLSDESTDPLKAIGLLVRYENQLNRTYDQSVKRLKELQENRPKDEPEIVERNEPTWDSESEGEAMLEIENVMRGPRATADGPSANRMEPQP